MERKGNRRSNLSVQGETVAAEIRKEKAKKPKLRKRPMNRRTAVVLAAALVLQGIFAPAGMALAYGRSGEEAEFEVPSEEGPYGLEMSAQDEDLAAATAGSAAPAVPAEGIAAPSALRTATAGNAVPAAPAEEIAVSPALRAAAVPDIWENWDGDAELPGDGTEERPYQISSLSHLMGLSRAVAEGETFAGEYFELTRDIDLGDLNVNGGSWNPIGWYQSSDEMEMKVQHPFSGHFDGRGNTIRNLNITRKGEPFDYAGLFGLIDGGSVENLKVRAGDICGSDHAAVLAAEIRGGAVIRNVTVSGYVSAENGQTGHAGGITAVTDGSGGRVTIENCTAQNISVISDQTESCVGGIAGVAKEADLVDNVVETGGVNSIHIQGSGYVGGIAGCMEDARIYNSYVSGLVGGHGSRAVGGLIGEYISGDLVLARFAGETASVGMGSLTRRGTFIGTRDLSHPFSYGTAAGDNLSYLFADTASGAKQAVGSGVAEDNMYSYSAHVGYWMDNQRSVRLLAGNTEKSPEEYFYQELENGVRFLVTEKLQNDFTAQGAAEGLNFRLDHFAPGQQGQPVKGYLLSVPRIDAKNAGGTYDTDVASFTAMPEGTLSYYRPIDKNHPAAVAAGVTVSVTTSPNNRDGNRYQMVSDTAEQGGVKPPVYINNAGRQVPMTYVAGGTYTFTMPERDTQINVEYVKVTTALTVTPGETMITVTQTRTGDRKAPDTVTEVHDGSGTLIARYIDDAPDTSIQVQPVRIHSEHNASGDTADRTVLWSVDDNDLISLVADRDYTEKDAQIMPNLNSAFIRKTLEEQIKAQADSGYLEAVAPMVYERHAVVTASSNPAVSADHAAVYGNCKVTVRFRILDYTTRRVEGMQLNKSDIVLTVTRKLTGLRSDPAETITCTEPAVLSAGLYPEQPFYKNVSWSDRGGGGIIVLTPQGENTALCAVTARFDPEGKANPAWIQNVINEDNQKKKEDPYARLEGTAEYTETVTAVSEDQTHGVVSASCRVTVRFETVDQTYYGSYGGSSGHTGSSAGTGGGTSGSSGSGQNAGPGIVFPGMPVPGAPGVGMTGPLGEQASSAVTGTWLQTEDGRWSFTAGQQSFRSQWAYIFNSYADPAKGQSNMDWFYFDADGYMATGWRWIRDGDGTERCYYFNEQPDGTRGAMLHGVTTPDGWQVDENGAWTVGGAVQVRQSVS